MLALRSHFKIRQSKCSSKFLQNLKSMRYYFWVYKLNYSHLIWTTTNTEYLCIRLVMTVNLYPRPSDWSKIGKNIVANGNNDVLSLCVEWGRDCSGRKTKKHKEATSALPENCFKFISAALQPEVFCMAFFFWSTDFNYDQGYFSLHAGVTMITLFLLLDIQLHKSVCCPLRKTGWRISHRCLLL